MIEFNPRDVIEIEILDHKAYVQVTHRHASYPPVVRALDGLHKDRPDDLQALVSGPTNFIAMIPLKSALSRSGARFELIEGADIPEVHRSFPTFRMPIRNKSGEIVYWWFWDGSGLSYDADLDADQEKLPLREVMTAQQFLERLGQMQD
ncbi:hypothetical protein SAMN04488523_11543 [Sulfitobacter brevis]|uniref:Uncharacterized protein n=1 Tax=Sulfitobacter brevis TaxID=74348 RepID=A0A1I2FDD6_9RHOB|nr:hypothetical protein [Sulfitobacter brevis]SFF02546.1 hypothetical protein SAMN04488523_11543 [Sulfitobacter brevis]